MAGKVPCAVISEAAITTEAATATEAVINIEAATATEAVITIEAATATEAAIIIGAVITIEDVILSEVWPVCGQTQSKDLQVGIFDDQVNLPPHATVDSSLDH